MLHLTKPVIMLSIGLGASACGGSGTQTITAPSPVVIPTVTPSSPGPTVPPAPGEPNTASISFGSLETISKGEPNPVDGVRYMTAFSAGGISYPLPSRRILGGTGSANIMYNNRNSGAYFHDFTEQGEDNLSAGVGFLFDGTQLGGYATRSGENFTSPSGSATFEGTYHGHIMEIVPLSVRGDVTLSADFDSNLIGGRISNRSETPNPFGSDNPQLFRNDLVLRDGVILSDGSFSSTLRSDNGGLISLQGGVGSYTGIFDEDASQVIGAVQLSHFNSVRGDAISLTESGIFIAD